MAEKKKRCCRYRSTGRRWLGFGHRSAGHPWVEVEHLVCFENGRGTKPKGTKGGKCGDQSGRSV